MVSEIGRGLPRPPSRRLTATANVQFDVGLERRSYTSLSAYFGNLSDNEAAALVRVLPHVLTVLKSLRKEFLAESAVSLAAAFDYSPRTIRQLNSQAVDAYTWRESILNDLPWIGLSEATARCGDGPWNPSDDLLVLPHQGRLHVPLFLFVSDGPPSGAWVTLLATLRSHKHRPTDWDVLAWLLRPHPLLDDRLPMVVYSEAPSKVRSLANSAAVEDRV